MFLIGYDGDYEYLKSRLPLIKCVCGNEILLVPDIKAMGRAIEHHARKHMKKEFCERKANEVFEKVSDDLISQLFDLVSSIKK